MVFNLLLLFQELQPIDSTTTTPTVENFSLYKVIVSGGPIGVIIVAATIALGAVGIYVFVERFLAIRRAAQIDENFMSNIRVNVQTGNIDAARQLCNSMDSPVARMIEKGLMRIGRPLRDINAAVENVGNLEVTKLEKNLSLLATISGAAPMLGFLGTVTGMIVAFYQMSIQENITPTTLAGGIYQALITTAFGLVIGILAFIGYNYLVNAVQKVVYNMEAYSMEFIDFLQEPA